MHLSAVAAHCANGSRTWNSDLFGLAKFEAPQTVTNLGSQLLHSHAILSDQPAGKGGARWRVVSEIERDAAVLAVLVPAEAAVGDIFRRQVL